MSRRFGGNCWILSQLQCSHRGAEAVAQCRADMRQGSSCLIRVGRTQARGAAHPDEALQTGVARLRVRSENPVSGFANLRSRPVLFDYGTHSAHEPDRALRHSERHAILRISLTRSQRT